MSVGSLPAALRQQKVSRLEKKDKHTWAAAAKQHPSQVKWATPIPGPPNNTHPKTIEQHLCQDCIAARISSQDFQDASNKPQDAKHWMTITPGSCLMGKGNGWDTSPIWHLFVIDMCCMMKLWYCHGFLGFKGCFYLVLLVFHNLLS